MKNEKLIMKNWGKSKLKIELGGAVTTAADRHLAKALSCVKSRYNPFRFKPENNFSTFTLNLTTIACTRYFIHLLRKKFYDF
jgi:hypothetical protein